MKGRIRGSFKKKLLACFIIVALVPLVVGGMFLIRMFKRGIARDYEKKTMEQAAAIEAILTGLLEECDQVTLRLSTDEEIRTTFMQQNSGNRNAVYTHLYEETQQLRDIAQVDLYSGDGICLFSTGASALHNRMPDYWGILKVAQAHPEEMVVRRDREYEYGVENVTLLRAARAIQNDKYDCIGFVVVSLKEETFDQVLNGTYGTQDGICILNSFWENVYEAGTAERENIGSVLRDCLLTGENLPTVWNDNRIYVSSLGDSGLYSILLRPEIFTEDTVREMYNAMAVMALISLLLCVAVAAGMSANLSEPVQSLSRAMNRVKGGELETRVAVGRQDEFGQLAENFNTMTAELKDYMEKQVSQQKQIDEISVAMMQAQLNPHFLYNTLDTMKWVAKANHIPELATLAAKLAKILRTSISSPQFITLKEEMELVDSYAQIQQIRFSGKFSFSYEIPQELERCMVPKLILQPIVENAILHGLAECEEGSIRIKAFLVKEELCLEVTDDGSGISDEVIGHLRSREQLEGHIGFYNVDTIIRLHYGDGYGLSACRPDEGGTKVTIVIPVRKGDAVHAESIGGGR